MKNATQQNPGEPKGRAKALVSILCVALAIGCATEVSNHTFIHQSYPPKPATAKIDVYTNGVPSRPFDRVAIFDVHCEGQGFVDPTVAKAIPLFIKEARSAGCDGVIEIHEEQTPANWTFETRVRQYSATGIVYK